MADSSALRQRIIDGARRAVDRSATALVEDDLRPGAPFRTGETRDKIDAVLGRGDPLHPSATVRSPTPQGKWVNDGTPPHVILPRFAKALRFSVGGRIVFARSVNHPGTRPNPWFDRATALWPDRLREQFQRGAWDR